MCTERLPCFRYRRWVRKGCTSAAVTGRLADVRELGTEEGVMKKGLMALIAGFAVLVLAYLFAVRRGADEYATTADDDETAAITAEEAASLA